MNAVGTATKDIDPTRACWCRGTPVLRDPMLHLGDHPEVNVCLACAHYLHKQANGLEDDYRTGLLPRVRDVLRSARRGVVGRGWHRSSLIGRPLQWIGRYLP